MTTTTTPMVIFRSSFLSRVSRITAEKEKALFF